MTTVEARPQVLLPGTAESVALRPREPFNFHQTLRFILSPPALRNGRPFAPLLDHFEDGEYRRAVEFRGEPVLFGVSERRQGTRSVLHVRILAGPADLATQSAVHRLVAWMLAADLDLDPFYHLAQSDEVLSQLVQHFRGMRIPQSASPLESLICAILEQQVNLTFAHQVKQALVAAYGDSIEFEGRRYRAFPQPAALAILTPRQLRRLQISGPKARYIIGLARAVLDGSLDLEGLRRLEPSRAEAKLRAHKGVGPWTAHYVGLRALGHPDCLPAADVGLQKAIQRFYGLRHQPSAAQVEKIARGWTGWRSYATFYLWRTYWEDRAWNSDLARKLAAQRQGGRP